LHLQRKKEREGLGVIQAHLTVQPQSIRNRIATFIPNYRCGNSLHGCCHDDAPVPRNARLDPRPYATRQPFPRSNALYISPITHLQVNSQAHLIPEPNPTNIPSSLVCTTPWPALCPPPKPRPSQHQTHLRAARPGRPIQTSTMPTVSRMRKTHTHSLHQATPSHQHTHRCTSPSRSCLPAHPSHTPTSKPNPSPSCLHPLRNALVYASAR
jgi:hypothetical protein